MACHGIKIALLLHDTLQGSVGSFGRLFIKDGWSCAQTLAHAMPGGKRIGMPYPGRNRQETEGAAIRTLQDSHSQLIVLRLHSIDTYHDAADHSISIGHMLGYTTACNRHAHKKDEEDNVETLHAEVS